MTTTTMHPAAAELRAEIDAKRERLSVLQHDERAATRKRDDARRARVGARAGGGDGRLSRATLRDLEDEVSEIGGAIVLVTKEITQLTAELRRAEGEEARDTSAQRASEAAALEADIDAAVLACGVRVEALMQRADAAGRAALDAERASVHRLTGTPLPMGHEQSWRRSFPAHPGLRDLVEEIVKYTRGESRAHLLAATARAAARGG